MAVKNDWLGFMSYAKLIDYCVCLSILAGIGQKKDIRMKKPNALNKSPPFIWSDYVFIALLFINLLVVISLGRNIFIQGDKLEQARKNGETVMVWANELDEDFANGKPITPKKCTPATDQDLKNPKFQANTWGGCINELFGPAGQFSQIKNPFMKNGLVWAKKCDREHQESKGALIFERLNPSPTGSPIISEFKESDVLVSGMDFRVSVCDRGFILIKIGEAKL